jgi:excinuclease UvrABC nuclease subunit
VTAPENALVPPSRDHLPCPPLPIRLALPSAPEEKADLRSLPARPGVFALEDERGGTLALGITADVRRLVRARLAPPDEDAGPSRRIDFRGLARMVAATTVGSAFEADWAYLQLARERLPHTYASLLDRWRGWFIHANPQADYPRFVKTNSPGSPPTGRTGVYLGPIADKHAAQRCIELLQDLFDLCRYYHILIEAPHATACAYKEMGKCPAPCDGSITMDEYRAMMQEAIDFAGGPIDEAVAAIESEMRRASESLDFEAAERLRRRLEAARDLAKPPYRFVDRLERFRYLAVLPSERPEYARLMLISGGWVEPLVDVPTDASDEALEGVALAIEERLTDPPADALSEESVQNIGLVCRYLFRPRKEKAAGEFVRIGRGLSAKTLSAPLRRIQGRLAKTADADDKQTTDDPFRDVVIEEAG